jgi:uncharacterized protein
MSRTTPLLLSALAAGVLFGSGLALSGMLQPRKVIAFLDIGGSWDPSLCCVMLGAIAVHSIAYWIRRDRCRPLFAERFLVPARSDIDVRLLAGASLFGVGWGLGGYCPGPAIASLISLNPGCVVFVACMLVGMWLASLWEAPRLDSQRLDSQSLGSPSLDSQSLDSQSLDRQRQA